MKTKVIIKQFHTHDVTRNMLKYIVYHNLDLFENERGKDITITHVFPNIIGKTTCIDTENIENPDIYYAVRGDRKYPSKMIRGVEAQDCSCATMIISRYKWVHEENTNLLIVYVITSYIGQRSPKELTEIEYKRSIGRIDFTPEEEREARSFWSHHALLA